MDAQRSRRTRDRARKSWYAHYRQVRFARWFGFIGAETDLKALFQRASAASDAAPEALNGPAPDASPAGILDGAMVEIS
ncbi:MAG: hypothetical protein U0790_15480 [Isosphaeraceae bacterium]